PGGAAHPGDPAVQGEADRVQHRGLAGAGGAVHEEQPGGAEPVEVDLLGAGERAEGLDGEAVQSHQAEASLIRSSSRAVRTSFRSSAEAGAPRAQSTKSNTRSDSARSAGRCAHGRSPAPGASSGSKT